MVKFFKKFVVICHGTTPLKKITAVTQTTLVVGRGSLYDPLSRTPPHRPVLRYLSLEDLIHRKSGQIRSKNVRVMMGSYKGSEVIWGVRGVSRVTVGTD